MIQQALRVFVLAVIGLLAASCKSDVDALRSSPLDAGLAPPSLFRDVTAEAGIDFQHRSGFVEAFHPNLLQTTGSGCALFDYDGDGFLDIYLVDGEHRPGGGNRLYRNRGDATFVDVTDAAGVRGHGYGMGCAVADYDGDGDVDLYVTNYGPNLLYRNNGDGTFTDVTAAAGAEVPQWSTVAAFFDADGDGDLDLYVGQYVRFTEESKQLCETMGVMGGCNPSEYEYERDVLLINDGAGHFHDGSAAAGVTDAGRALGVLVDDYDGDGRPDILVANDGTANHLFRNLGGGRFEEVGVESGVAYGPGGRAEASMGVDLGDYDGDGKRDLAIGNFEGEMTSLYRYLGDGQFLSSAAESRLGALTAPVLTFGIAFLDYDNDGDLDLAQANGHVHPLIGRLDPEAPYEQSRQLLENTGGIFVDRSEDAGPGFIAPTVGRGMAFGDLDNDGDIDLVTNNNGRPAVVLLNENRTGNHWLGVRLTHPRGEAQVLGARVTVSAGDLRVARYARTAYSYACANDPRLHFGLGERDGTVKIVVAWPDGSSTTVDGVGVDRYVSISPAGLGQ